MVNIDHINMHIENCRTEFHFFISPIRILLRPLFVILYFLILQLQSTACMAEKIPVITSIYPIADMVKQVGDDYVDVTFVLPSGASPHTFEPKPSLVKKFSSARIYFMVGAGLEFWSEKFVNQADPRLMTVVLSKEVPLLQAAESHDRIKTEHHQARLGSSEPEPTIANPHIWLDPVIAKIMVKKIIAALGEVDYHHVEDYQKRGQRYLNELDKLHQLINATVETFGIKKYVSYHNSWVYFARRYGLESVGVIEAAPGRNPTPTQIKDIVADIKKHGIRAVFAEPQFNPRAAEVVAREAGVDVLFLDPMGGYNLKDRQTYVDLMKYNLRVLQGAME